MSNQEQELILLSLSDAKESTDRAGWYQWNTGEDVIYYRYGNPPMQRHTEVSLTAGEDMTWWKGIELVKENKIVRSVETQDNTHGPREFNLGINNFDRAEYYTLFLCKAKEFGIHRRMYYIPGTEVFSRRIEFYWQKD